jgi:hypothetical protein
MPDFITAVPIIMRRTLIGVSGFGARGAARGRAGRSETDGAERTGEESSGRVRASPVRREKLWAAAWGAAETGVLGRDCVSACAAWTRKGKDKG